MAWGNNKIRHAGSSDIEELVELTRLARQESPLTAQLCTPNSGHITELLTAWYSLEGGSLLVAESDGKIVGLALVQHVAPSLFSDVAYLQIEGLFVREEFRRRGVARGLLTEVVNVAEASQVERIVTIVLTGSRRELRFRAGVGCMPAGARRLGDRPTVHRSLSRPKRERRLRSIDELIAPRRRTRDLTTTS